MATKTKTKKVTKKKQTKRAVKATKKVATVLKSKKPTKKKIKHYHPSYLALLVAGILLLEGLLFSISTPADWKYGAQILDLRPAISETFNDFAEIMTPVIDLTRAVNQFYVLAADEAIVLLDLSPAVDSLKLIYSSVDQFYEQASIAMSDLLGITGSSLQGNVAGISIEN